MVAPEIFRSSTMWLPAFNVAAGGAATAVGAPVDERVVAAVVEAAVDGAAVDDSTELSVSAGGDVP
ncbi:MAG: hypothetical protein M3Y77_11150 [Actinomycetota bacterium]|nr:hypothetical protein [Actinomycetota bacterium]